MSKSRPVPLFRRQLLSRAALVLGVAGLAGPLGLCGMAQAQVAQQFWQCRAQSAGVEAGWCPVAAANPLPVTGSITANSSVTAIAALPTLTPGSQSPQASLAGAQYVQPVFSSTAGGGTQVDATHGLPVAILAGAAVIGHVITDTTSTTAATQATASALNATVVGAGTAGTANAGVVTVQGIASMTPVQVSQATAGNLNATVVQGTGTNLHAVLDTTSTTAVTQATAANLNATVVGAGSTAAPGAGILPIVPLASAAATAGVAPVVSSAVETGHVIKASAGNLYDFNVSADSTLSAAAWWVMIFNSTTVPAAGSVTPVKCYALPVGATSISAAFPTPLYLSTGISMAVSTNGCFTKADSAHGFISANAQ